MSFFQDPSELTDEQIIEQKSIPTESSTGIPLLWAVGFGGIGLLISANPVVAAAMAFPFGYDILRKLKKTWRDHHFLSRFPGCIAHLIKEERDMVKWLEIHGKTVVSQQLLTAHKEGQEFTGIARRTFKALLPPELTGKATVNQFLLQSAADEVKGDSSPIGAETRLNSIDVQAVETKVSDFSESGIEINLPEYIAKNLYSYAIIGASGSGKGFLLSHAVREIKALFPDLKIVLLDPKNDPRESGYWQGAIDFWMKGDFLNMSGAEKSEWIRNGIETYQQIQGEKLLIFDEATAQFSHMNGDRALLQDVKSFLTGIASSGNSRNNFVFLVGHTPNLGDYGISSGMMSSFRKIYIARNNNVEAIKQLGNTVFCGGKFGEDEVNQIVKISHKSDIGRAVYLGSTDSWMPLQKLENLSGYNRDSGSFVGHPRYVQDDIETESNVITVENKTEQEEIEELSFEDKVLQKLAAYVQTKGCIKGSAIKKNKPLYGFEITKSTDTQKYLDLAVERNILSLSDEGYQVT